MTYINDSFLWNNDLWRHDRKWASTLYQALYQAQFPSGHFNLFRKVSEMSDKKNEQPELKVRDLKLGDEVEYHWSERDGWLRFTVFSKTAQFVRGGEPLVTLTLHNDQVGNAFNIRQEHVPHRLRMPTKPDERLANVGRRLADLRAQAQALVDEIAKISREAK